MLAATAELDNMCMMCYRSHFGSRYTLGCCILAGLLSCSGVVHAEARLAANRVGSAPVLARQMAGWLVDWSMEWAGLMRSWAMNR